MIAHEAFYHAHWLKIKKYPLFYCTAENGFCITTDKYEKIKKVFKLNQPINLIK